MPIPNYSVLAGAPTAGKVVSGKSSHYQITIDAPGGQFMVAVNIQSVDGSEVLYVTKESFVPPNQIGLLALPMGMTPVKSAPGGLALDFVRSTVSGQPMITRGEMVLLPQLKPVGSEEQRLMNRVRAKALENAVVTLLNMTIADKDGVIYAFGSAFSDRGKVNGIHNIHLNQGNAAGSFAKDNGVWQDGALLIHLPSKGTWTAVFIAFQTESWQTDSAGNPLYP